MFPVPNGKFSSRFFNWFRRFSPGYSKQKFSSPHSFSEFDGHTHLDIEIYQTQKLTEENGRWPEQNAVRFLGQALEDAGYNYTFHFGFESLPIHDAPTSKNLQEFRDTNPQGDKNILIGHRVGGGLSGPTHALTAGIFLDEKLELTTVAPHGDDDRVGFPYKHILNHLHETGHLLGGTHSDKMLDEPSLLWTESGKSSFNNPAAVPE